jgi:hypothetical protein
MVLVPMVIMVILVTVLQAVLAATMMDAQIIIA